MKALDLVVKSQYQDVVLALLMTPAEYDAHEMRKALKVMHSNSAFHFYFYFLFNLFFLQDLKTVNMYR